MRLRWLCALVMLLLALAGARAVAAEPAISPEAKRHVDLGMQHYEAGRYQDAIGEFELAYRLSQRAALLYNIARAEAKLGHDDAAIAFLRRYLEERPDAPDAPAVRAEIEARESAIASGKAKRQAEADAAEARMRADALAREQARRDEERLRLEAQQPALRQNAATAPEGAAATNANGATNASGATNAANGASSIESDSAARVERRAGIALLVAGPVLAVVGIGLGVLAKQSGDDVSSRSGDFAANAASLESRGQAAQSAGLALDVIGGAAAVTGAVLLGLSFRSAKSGRAWIAPSANGVMVGGVF
ncbi:MAG TPA: hypothetical protein VFF06_13090 [Polyangia bacterium]|nr:hypothetical protein [Polyangia bacterium]